MNKENIYKYLFAISIFLIIIFLILIRIDYFNYDALSNSAPFYTYIIMRSLEFILPSIILFLIGLFCKKKYNK